MKCLGTVWLGLLGACALQQPAQVSTTPIVVQTIQVEMRRTPDIVLVDGHTTIEEGTVLFHGILTTPDHRRARPSMYVHVRIAASGERCRGRVRTVTPDEQGSWLSITLECDDPVPSGTAAVAEWITGERFGLFVPRDVLATGASTEKPCVWVVTNGVIARRTVGLGQTYLDAVEIVDGLTGGERVIRQPSAVLIDGQLVQPDGNM